MTDEEIRLEAAKMSVQLIASNAMRASSFNKNVRIIYDYIKYGKLSGVTMLEKETRDAGNGCDNGRY